MASDRARRAHERARDAADNGGTDARTYAASLIADMAAAIAGADEPIDYLIDRFAAPGFLTIVVGRHSAYKSWLLMAWPPRPRRPHGIAGLARRPARALYVDAENGCRLLGRRSERPACPPRRSSSPMPSGGCASTISRAPRARGAGRGAARRLDSLRGSTRRQGERLDEIAPLLGELAALARELNIAIVLIHASLDQSRRTRATPFLVDRGPGGPRTRVRTRRPRPNPRSAPAAHDQIPDRRRSRRLAGSGSAMSARTSRSTPPTHSTAPMTRWQQVGATAALASGRTARAARARPVAEPAQAGRAPGRARATVRRLFRISRKRAMAPREEWARWAFP